MQSHVLIVEPDCAVAEELRQLLAQRGYDVEIACGGLDAVERLRLRTPRLVVMSTTVPWGGSDGVLEMMRCDSGVPCVPVVQADGEGNGQFGNEPMAAPVVERLHKPVAPLELFSVLERVTPNGR